MSISVVTINYNDVEGLKRTFKSVFSQTLSDFEYIVIDGGSTDGSKQLIQENSNRITYWISEKDSGVYNAMNKAIKIATGNYLLFLNGGDEFYGNDVLKIFEQHNYSQDIVYGNYVHFDGEKEIIIRHPDKLTFNFFFKTSLCHQTVFFKKTIFDKVGLYDENLKIVSDWKVMLLAIANQNCSYIHHNYTVSKFYEGGISSNVKEMLRERDQVLRENFPFYYQDYKAQPEFYQRRWRYLLEIEKHRFAKKATLVLLKIMSLMKF